MSPGGSAESKENQFVCDYLSRRSAYVDPRDYTTSDTLPVTPAPESFPRPRSPRPYYLVCVCLRVGVWTQTWSCVCTCVCEPLCLMYVEVHTQRQVYMHRVCVQRPRAVQTCV